MVSRAKCRLLVLLNRFLLSVFGADSAGLDEKSNSLLTLTSGLVWSASASYLIASKLLDVLWGDSAVVCRASNDKNSQF
jgi:hypothetical protein